MLIDIGFTQEFLQDIRAHRSISEKNVISKISGKSTFSGSFGFAIPKIYKWQFGVENITVGIPTSISYIIAAGDYFGTNETGAADAGSMVVYISDRQATASETHSVGDAGTYLIHPGLRAVWINLRAEQMAQAYQLLLTNAASATISYNDDPDGTASGRVRTGALKTAEIIV